jgi:hypothetical protein
VAAQINTYQDAVQAIVSVMTDDLQLPVPPTSMTLYFYPYREAFAQGLTDQFNTEPALARTIAKTALGRLRQTDAGKRFLVNDEILGSLGWPERIHVLAHELAHIVQYELAGGRLIGELWLIEGFADWVGYQVLEVLGLDTVSRRKAFNIAQIRQQRELTPLSQMITVQEWQALNAKYGSAIPHAQAFLATELLIEQQGRAAILEYFRRAPHTTDFFGTFRSAFGIEPSAFQQEFSRCLDNLQE